MQGGRAGVGGVQKALSGGDKSVVAVQPPPFIYLSYLQMAAKLLCCGQDTVTSVDQLSPQWADKRLNITSSRAEELYCNYFCAVGVGGWMGSLLFRFKSEGKKRRRAGREKSNRETNIRRVQRHS